MRQFKFYLLAFLLPTLFIFTSCGNPGEQSDATTDSLTVETTSINEFEILVNYLEENGNFINSKSVPAMIKSKEVHENMGNEKYLVIDLRKQGAYNKGHIEGAINVKTSELINYFENEINTSDYEKIALACYSGQSASYATGVLRLLGYDNVYAMKFGMSFWNSSLAEGVWMKHISSDYQNQLETTANPKSPAGDYPTISTSNSDPKEILKARAQVALSQSYKTLLVKADEMFSNGSSYYIMNYWPDAKYTAGHIPGAIQYTPKKSLSTTADLATLPTDKPVVTYCFTGQHAGFVTAYLTILGYDARALAYGANSFMNNTLIENEWHPFIGEKVHNYELTEPTIEDDNAEIVEEGGCG